MKLNKIKKNTPLLTTFLVILVAAFSNINAQPFLESAYKYPTVIPEGYVFRHRECMDDIVKTQGFKAIKPKFQEAALLEEIKNGRGIYESFYFYNGNNVAENYLNEILQLILRKNNLIIPELKLRLAKTNDVNAFMNFNGTMVINLGLLLYCNTEAEIAAIVCHELAHYMMSHPSISYNQMSTVNKYMGFALVSIITINNFYSNSREQETQADTIGLALYDNSLYNLHGFVNMEKTLLALEDKERHIKSNQGLKNYIYGSNPFGSTHPSGTSRVKMIQKLMNNLSTANNTNFFLGESRFKQIKDWAIGEALRNAFLHYDYENGFEIAFEQFLMDPANEMYTYYLIDLITKYCHLHPEEINSPFILNRFTIKDAFQGVPAFSAVILVTNAVGGAVHNHGNFYKKDETILDHLNENILLLQQGRVAPELSTFLAEGKSKFCTYAQALDYFVAYAETKKFKNSDFPLANYFQFKQDTLKYREFINSAKLKSSYFANVLAGKQGVKSKFFYYAYPKVESPKEFNAGRGKRLPRTLAKLQGKVGNDFNSFISADSIWNSNQLYYLHELKISFLVLKLIYLKGNNKVASIPKADIIRLFPEILKNMENMDTHSIAYLDMNLFTDADMRYTYNTIDIKNEKIIFSSNTGIMKNKRIHKKVGKMHKKIKNKVNTVV